MRLATPGRATSRVVERSPGARRCHRLVSAGSYLAGSASPPVGTPVALVAHVVTNPARSSASAARWPSVSGVWTAYLRVGAMALCPRYRRTSSRGMPFVDHQCGHAMADAMRPEVGERPATRSIAAGKYQRERVHRQRPRAGGTGIRLVRPVPL